MKTMIEVKNNYGENIWIALDEIEEIREQDGFCWVVVDWGRYIYPGTLEQLVAATRSAIDVRGEMTLIRMDEKHSG